MIVKLTSYCESVDQNVFALRAIKRRALFKRRSTNLRLISKRVGRRHFRSGESFFPTDASGGLKLFDFDVWHVELRKLQQKYRAMCDNNSMSKDHKITPYLEIRLFVFYSSRPNWYSLLKICETERSNKLRQI